MVANAGVSIMKSIIDSEFGPSRLPCLRLTSSWPATANDLDRILGVNLRGTFCCYKYAGKQMIAQGRGGRIIGDPPILVSRIVSLTRARNYRCMLRHGQARPSIPRRIFCQQIRHPGVDTMRWCVLSLSHSAPVLFAC